MALASDGLRTTPPDPKPAPTRKVSYWTCPSCKNRNERTSSRTCAGCGKATKPKRRVPKHALTLRDDGYPVYRRVNEVIHRAGDDCGVCGRPPSQERHHDRDHDHLTGKPRGLACGGNRGCNALMPSWLTADRAEAIAAYLRRVETYYAREDL